MRHKLLMLLSLLVCLSFASITRAQQDPLDPDNADTLTFVSTACLSAVSVDRKAVVEIQFYNDELLGAVTLPVKWSSSAITLDSVSWVGGRLAYLNTRVANIDNANQQANIGAVVILEDYVAAGQGLACKLYFNIPAGTPDQVVTVASTFVAPAAYDEFSLTNGTNFSPQIKAGTLTIGSPPPTIAISPSSFTFRAAKDGSNPDNQILNISNTGYGTLNWTASDDANWLTLNPASGVGDDSITVSVNIAGLAVGTYNATITVSDTTATNNPQTASVELTIEDNPSDLSVSPLTYDLGTVCRGDHAAADGFTIANVGGDTIHWTFTASPGIVPSSDTGVAISDEWILLTHDFVVNTDDMSYGAHDLTIVVDGGDALHSPQTIHIAITVVSCYDSVDPGNADTLRIGSAVTSAGQQPVVDVYFYNDEELSSASAYFKWSTDDITVDSVSFVGSRVEYVASKSVDIYNNSQEFIASFAVSSEGFLSVGNGLFAKIYFRVPSSTADQTVTIDTATVFGIRPPALFTDTTGSASWAPQVVSGTLTIGGGGTDEDIPVVPSINSLSQNYPNPFNPTTTIKFSLEKSGQVNISVFNILGQKIKTLINEIRPAGENETYWDGKDSNGSEVASGVYFYRVRSSALDQTRKMILMR